MKLRNIIASFLAVVAVAVGCTEELTGNLSSIKLDQSTIVFPEQGGSVTITVTATTDWSVDAATVPAEVTVNPMSGGADETKMTISTNGGSVNDIASDIVILVGNQKQFIKFYQPADPSLKPKFEEFEAGEYWIMCKEGDEWFALKSTGCTIDDGGSYNYLYSVPAVVAEDGTLSSTASNVFTFEAVEGGFIIKDPAGGYLYQVAKYHNFYLTSDKSKASVWTVSQTSDDEFMVEIPSLSKWMQYSTSYDSAGAYPSAQDGATLPKLVKAEAPAVEPFVIEETEFELPIEGGELLIPVTYNGTDIHVDGMPAWLAFYGYHEGNLKFTYEANTAGNREAVVVLTTCMEDGRECEVELTFKQKGTIVEATVADFLAAETGTALYQLTGKVANLQAGDYGNFNLVDATGSVYVYGLTATQVEKNDKSFPSLGIKEGDVVTLIGTRADHNGTAQVGGPAYYVSHIGHTEVTIAEFLTKEKSKENWYKLTGTIEEIVKEEYGNFYLKDDTGRVFVYGLTVAPVAKNDKSFAKLGLKVGDKVTLIGTKDYYEKSSVEDQKHQVGGPAYYISHETPAEGGDDTGNEGGNDEGDSATGTYTYTFAKDDLGANGTPSSEVTLNGVKWNFSMTDSGSKYLGWDSNETAKGVQIGKGSDPATEVVLSTEGVKGTVKSIKVNTSGASDTDAVLNVTVGGAAFGTQATLTKTATDYTFTGSASGKIVLKWTCTQKAIYVKSIEIVAE